VRADPGEVAASAWIAVLPREASEELLARLGEDLRQRGWAADASRGEEQAILAVEGPRDAAALRAVLPGDLEADVFPLLEAAEYRRLRQRRRFLSALVAGLSLLIAVGLAWPLVGFLEPPPRTILAPDWMHVPAADRLQVGEAVRTQVRGKSIWVVRLAAARWHALSAACTYFDECLLEWDRERREFLCPCHGCAFDAHGNVVHAPASIPLVAREVELREGAVFVRRAL